MPYLVKALRSMAAALTATRDESILNPTDDANIHRLVDMAALPLDALRVLDLARPGAPAPLPGEIETLMVTTARILASVRRSQPTFSARAGAVS